MGRGWAFRARNAPILGTAPLCTKNTCCENGTSDARHASKVGGLELQNSSFERIMDTLPLQFTVNLKPHHCKHAVKWDLGRPKCK